MLFTQNIDCLERRAGVPADKIVEAHGSFATQRCIECKAEFPDDEMKDHVFAGMVPQCEQPDCSGTVKPDIVFFGEALPSRFGDNAHQNAMADLMLVIGTSLTVYPFAGLPQMARAGKPRVLFNMERVGEMGNRADDVLQLGSCDEGIRKLADLLGWRDELEALWKDVVGEKEAKRQMESQKAHEEDVEDEVNKLTEGVEAALNFSDSDSDASTSSQRENTSKEEEEAGKDEEKPPPNLDAATTKTGDSITTSEAEGTKSEPKDEKEKPSL